MDAKNARRDTAYRAMCSIEWLQEFMAEDDPRQHDEAANAAALMRSLGYSHAGRSWDECWADMATIVTTK